jgi:hypothetical protein
MSVFSPPKTELASLATVPVVRLGAQSVEDSIWLTEHPELSTMIPGYTVGLEKLFLEYLKEEKPSCMTS